jgi:hypothetical protein
MGGLDRTGQGISEWKSFDEAILVVLSLPSDFLLVSSASRLSCTFAQVAKGFSPSGADICFWFLTGDGTTTTRWSNQISQMNSNSESK